MFSSHAQEAMVLDNHQSPVPNFNSSSSSSRSERPNNSPVLSNLSDRSRVEANTTATSKEQPRSKILFAVVREILKSKSIPNYNGSGDVDDWFEQMDIVIADLELTDKEKIYLLKNLVKDQALTALRSFVGKTFQEYQDILLRRFRGPGAMWKKLDRLGRIVQRPRDNIDQYYQYQVSEIRKTEKLVKDTNGVNFLIPMQMKIHRFIEGLKNKDIKEKLYIEKFDTLEQYFERAVILEQSNPNFGIGSKRSSPGSQYFGSNKKQRLEGTAKQLRCFECNKLGHKAKDCRNKHSNLNSMRCFGCNEEGHRIRDCPKKDHRKPPYRGSNNKKNRRQSNFNGMMNGLNSMFEMTEEEETLDGKPMLAYAFAKIKRQVTKVLIDSGAAYNCISVDFANKLGLKKLIKVKCPPITLPDGKEIRPIGMAKLNIQFTKDSEEVKFLVIQDLSQDCILGQDGQEQFRVRLDWEQKLIRFHGEPVPMERSHAEASMHLACLTVEDAFNKKLQRMRGNNLQEDTYNSVIEDEHYEDAVRDKYVKQTTKDVTVGLVGEDGKNIYFLLNKYSMLFKPVTRCASNYSHRIQLTDTVPVRCVPYKISPRMEKVMNDEVMKMLTDGTIRRSKSNYASPALLVPKPDGTWRFCVDYTKLNLKTKSDNYPIPNAHSRLMQLHGAKVFAKMDGYKGFWQIPMDNQSIEKTAFITPFGLFEFNVLPMGLKTSPATFQRMMDTVLGDMIDNGVLVYLDDILVYAENNVELQKLTEEVFQRLEKAGIHLKASKCFIGMNKIDFLGFVVSGDGIHPQNSKVKVINYLKPPRTVRQLRRFLGIMSYYRNFINNFSTLAAPLNTLLKKKTLYNWSKECQLSFEKLKEALTEDVVLAHPDLSKPFVIFTDASNHGVGAVLTQDGRPVWFASRSLNPLERKYDTREKEAIGIRFGLEKFKPYFYPNQVTVFNDHGNLRWLMSQKQTGRLARWQLDLQQYDFKIAYIKGENNPVADCLSRDIDDQIQLMAMTRLQARRIQAKNYEESSDELDELTEGHNGLKDSREAKGLGSLYYSIDWISEQRKDKNVLGMAKDITRYVVKDGLVYRRRTDKGHRLVVPKHLVMEFISKVHDSKLCAHGGIEKTSYHLRSVWFPSMRRHIRDYCHSCYTCLETKGMDNRHNVFQSRKPAALLDRVYIDIVGKLPNDTSSYDKDNRYILTMMDDCSRFLRAVAIPNKSAEVILEAFRDNWAAIFGIPKELVSDRAKELIGQGMIDLLNEGSGKSLPTAAYSPEANAVERVHKTLTQRLRALTSRTGKPWSSVLAYAVHGYNVTIHSITGVAPFTLMLSKEVNITTHHSIMKSDIQAVRDQANHISYAKRTKVLNRLNGKRIPESLAIGDQVAVHNPIKVKLGKRILDESYTIIDIIGNKLIRVQDPYGKQTVRSRKQIRKLNIDDTNS